MMVIVPSGEFFTKTRKEKRLGRTSTYKYKTIHIQVSGCYCGTGVKGSDGRGVILRPALLFILFYFFSTVLRCVQTGMEGEWAPQWDPQCPEMKGKRKQGSGQDLRKGLSRTRRAPRTDPP